QNHAFYELSKPDLWRPAQALFRFRGVGEEHIDLRGAQVPSISSNEVLPVEPDLAEGELEELTYRVGLASPDHEVIRHVVLEHPPHRLDIVGCVAPVAFGVDVSQEKFFLKAVLDAAHGAGDFSGHEGFAASLALMIEEDAVGCEEAVRFPVILRDVIGI